MSYRINCHKCRGRGTTPVWDKEQTRITCDRCEGSGCE